MPSEHLSQGDIGYQARPHGAQQAFPGSPQGAVNGGAHALPQTQLVYPHGGQVQSGMVVIRPPQPGQAPQLVPAPRMSPSPINPRYSGKQASSPPGIGQSVAPQDRQTTVDQLARLKPHSSPKTESGYTKGQRDDMNRFFQAAEGE